MVLKRFVLALVLMSMCGCSWIATRSKAPGLTLRQNTVVFRYYAPNAVRVQVAGDWPDNNWARGNGSTGEADIGLMSDSDGDGVWELAVALQPGRYHYLFWVNEDTFVVDPANPYQVNVGPFGLSSELLLIAIDDEIKIR